MPPLTTVERRMRGPAREAGDGGHKHYHLKGIVNAIKRSALSAEGQDRAVHLFERLVFMSRQAR